MNKDEVTVENHLFGAQTVQLATIFFDWIDRTQYNFWISSKQNAIAAFFLL